MRWKKVHDRLHGASLVVRMTRGLHTSRRRVGDGAAVSGGGRMERGADKSLRLVK